MLLPLLALSYLLAMKDDLPISKKPPSTKRKLLRFSEKLAKREGSQLQIY